MDITDACTARRRILELLVSARSDGMPNDVVQFVDSIMEAYVCSVKSLQVLTELALFKAVHRRISALRSLTMPKRFLEAISELFNVDI